jgi:prolyl oligopeptidase
MLRPVASRGDTLYVFTDYEAPRGRVAAIDLNNPERKNWKTVVPETAATLKQVQLVGGAIVLAYMKDVAGEVVVRPLAGGAARTVPLPRNATLNLAEDSDRYFSVASFTSPESVYECRPECRALQTVVLPFDAAKIEVKQVFYAAKDGTKIPMFVAHKAGLALDGAAPALLYAYGGFNISITPTFRPLFAAWMDLGGVLAVANLRGGGEYGEEWHRAGMRGLKQNVFDDFIAAAEWLIENQYTSSKRLAIHGASNGGLLVGAVLNQRPELFGAAVPSVGVMDMLRFHKFTIGHAWIPEYGDPGNPEEFRILGRYSPLQNVRDLTHYPATLILTADHDDRVAPAHSFKYAAAMQNEQRGPAPVLIRIESNAGHGGGKPVSKRIEEDAAILTFLSRVFGLP